MSLPTIMLIQVHLKVHQYRMLFKIINQLLRQLIIKMCLIIDLSKMEITITSGYHRSPSGLVWKSNQKSRQRTTARSQPPRVRQEHAAKIADTMNTAKIAQVAVQRQIVAQMCHPQAQTEAAVAPVHVRPPLSATMAEVSSQRRQLRLARPWRAMHAAAQIQEPIRQHHQQQQLQQQRHT